MQPEFDLFISYSSRDKQIADPLLAGLEADGIRCWIAPRNVQPGKSWAGSILRGIRDADVFMLVLTGQSNQSNQVLNEVERAISLNKPIICYRAENVVLSDDLELFLSSKHWIEASGQPVETTLPMLTAAIRPLLVHRQAIPQPVPDEHTTPEEREEFLRNGKRAYLAQDFTLAGEYFNEAAEAGSGEALFYVGEMNRKSEGTKRAPAKARQLYKSAIDKGSALGNWGLARMLDEADELPDRARQYYEQARETIAEKAVEEDAYCCYLYSLMYDEGKGVNKDAKRAERWLEKARENGYKPAVETSIPQPEAPPAKTKPIIPGPAPDQSVKVDNVPQSAPAPATKANELAEKSQTPEPVPFGAIPFTTTSETPYQPNTPKPGETASKPTSDTQSPWKGILIGLALVGTITTAVKWCEERKTDETQSSYSEADSAMMMDSAVMVTDTTVVADSAVSYSNKSAAELLPLAEAGDAEAQNLLGRKYDDGTGVLNDDQKAVVWYRKAAEQGHAIAQYNLGVMYDDGEGVAQNYQEALRWYGKAAAQSHAGAQNNIGWMYKNGHGVSKDYAIALVWFRKATRQGNASAQYNIGRMYGKGEEVLKDYTVAAEWYRKAAEQGHSDAQVSLGVMYDDGLGVKQSYAEAIKWYRKSVAQGNAYGQYDLGDMYEYGKGVTKDIAEAKRLYKLAATQGNKDAKSALKRLNG